MDINYELYKVFYFVASSLSFSEASKKLFISQSAVSQSIKTLERKLEQPLFIRSTKKVQLTPAGKVLLKHVEPAMNLIARGESQLLDASNLGLGQLHIGASDTICRYFLVPYLKEFHKKFPNVPIKVTNGTSLKCVDLLTQGKVDIIVTNFPNSHLNPSYLQKTVANFHDVFIANPSYYQLKQKEISFEELKQYPLMMLERKSTTSEFLHKQFLQHQLELIPEIELSSNDLLIDMARIGLGIAFVPDYCVDNSKDLFILKTKEKMPMRQMVASVNTSLPISPSTEAFLNLLPTIDG
ncbi:DNA-binding transcriptional regulator, LysR family [Lachnospiraceae bacterium C7]|nr:DNA-binding transcriptional regulator, LysR family [Lachnospiraceae bacterium C7]